MESHPHDSSEPLVDVYCHDELYLTDLEFLSYLDDAVVGGGYPSTGYRHAFEEAMKIYESVLRDRTKHGIGRWFRR